MAGANFRINQATHPTAPVGVAGLSRDDLILAGAVTLVNTDDGGARAWRWEMIDRPTGSSAVLSNPLAAQATFTPDVYGSYLIQLTLDDGGAGKVQRLIAAVRDPAGFRYPAAGENREANWGNNTRGWWPDLELFLRSIGAANLVFDAKQSCRVGTVAALPAHTRVDNVLTASANGALTVDGVAVAAQDRVLVKSEAASHLEHGIYVVTQPGTAGTPWILTRAVDADTSAKVTAGLWVIVTEGATLADTAWFITSNDPIVLNTTAITLTQFPLSVHTWAQVLAAGRFTGGTDPAWTAGDEAQWVDGSNVVRAAMDWDSGGNTWRARFYSAAAALLATLAIHTGTGALTWSGGAIDLGSANISNGGTYNGVTVQTHAARHAFGGADPLPADAVAYSQMQNVSTSARVLGRAVGAGAGDITELDGDQLGAILDAASEFVRRDGTTPLTASWDAGAFTITANRLWADGAAAPQMIVGDPAGVANLRFDAAAATSAWIRYTQASVVQWDEGQTHNDVNWYLDRFVAGAFQDSVVVAQATGLWTYPGSATWGSASPVLTIGNLAGSPVFNLQKDLAGEVVIAWRSDDAGPATRWEDTFVSDEGRGLRRYTSASALVNTAMLFAASATQAAAYTYLSDGNIELSYTNAFLGMGDGAGSVVSWRRKTEAGTDAEGHFSNGFLRWYAWYFDTDESLKALRYDSAGALVNTALSFNAATTAATTATTFGDATTAWGYIDPILQIGTVNTSLWTIDIFKDETGQGGINLYNESVRRFSWAITTGENTQFSHWSAASALLSLLQFQAGADQLLFMYTPSPTITTGDGSGSPAGSWQKSEAGAITRDLSSNAVVRVRETLDGSEVWSLEHYSAVPALDAQISLAAALFTFGATTTSTTWAAASPLLTIGSNAGSPQVFLTKTEAGTATPFVIDSNGATRFRAQLNSSEEFDFLWYTAAAALETQINILGSGFIKLQTHFAITDAIAAPSALAGFAKFYLDSGANGRPKIIEADGAIEQLGVGIGSEAMPVVSREFSDITVSNTVTETDILSFSIPANTLGIRGVVKAHVAGNIHHEGTATIRVRVYLGATTVYDSTSPTLTATADDDAAFFIEVTLPNRGATNAQRAFTRVFISSANDSGPTGALGGDMANATPQVNTCGISPALTVDTTSAQTLRISVTWSAAAATNTLVRREGYQTLSAAA